MDLDKNGYLSKGELKQGYSNRNFELSDEGVDLILENVDYDEDGRVNLGEYVLLLSKMAKQDGKFREQFFSHLTRK